MVQDPELADRLEILERALEEALMQVRVLRGENDPVRLLAPGRQEVPTPTLSPAEQAERKKQRQERVDAKRRARIQEKVKLGEAMSEGDL